MKARNFDTHHSRAGVFDIYTSEKYKEFILIIATCPTASDLVHWAAETLTKVVMDFTCNPRSIKIDVYDASDKDRKNTFTCVSTILAAGPSDVKAYILKLGLKAPQPTDIDTTNLSVGPCAFRATDGSKYVKVRMSGYSVPLVLENNEVSWDRAATRQAILKSGIGGCLLDQLMRALESKSHYIMERARKKLLNLSHIDEYAKYKLSYFKEYEPGMFDPATHLDISNPEYKPVVVFSLGSMKFFVMINDKIYKIDHFIVDIQGSPTPSMYLPTGRSGYFKFSDCAPVSAEDTFTLDKIQRCLANKL